MVEHLVTVVPLTVWKGRRVPVELREWGEEVRRRTGYTQVATLNKMLPERDELDFVLETKLRENTEGSENLGRAGLENDSFSFLDSPSSK